MIAIDNNSDESTFKLFGRSFYHATTTPCNASGMLVMESQDSPYMCNLEGYGST